QSDQNEFALPPKAAVEWIDAMGHEQTSPPRSGRSERHCTRGRRTRSGNSCRLSPRSACPLVTALSIDPDIRPLQIRNPLLHLLRWFRSTPGVAGFRENFVRSENPLRTSY